MLKKMHMTIAERLKPFSHHSGITALLPFSTLSFTIYPAAIHVFDLNAPFSKVLKEINLHYKGIIEGFTVQQDLEKGCLRVWGKAQQGYFRYRIQAVDGEKSYVIIPEKEPSDATFCAEMPADSRLLPPFPSLENLSFGVSKAQDWTMVHRRLELAEILPLWYRLGQLTPFEIHKYAEIPHYGTLKLLHALAQALDQKQVVDVSLCLRELYLAGFEGMLCPRLEDSQYQGFALPPLSQHHSLSPLLLLSHGKTLIKRMLLDCKDDCISILPCLPAEFHCGRLLNASLPNAGVLDMEWSKKTIRRMRFSPSVTAKLQFQFPINVKSFRLQRQSDGSTQFRSCGEAIDFSSTDHYQFDNFKR